MTDRALTTADSLVEDRDSHADKVAAAALERDVRGKWLLSLPAVLIILGAAVGPLLVMILYAFLEKSPNGGVLWKFSTDAWVQLILTQDIFDDSYAWADAHLIVFWRSIKLSLLTTFLTLIVGLPTAYFIATRPERYRDIWLFLVTIPFWTNQLIRTFAIQELIRKDGVINNLLLWVGAITAPIQMLNTDFAIAFGMTYVFLPLMVLPIYASIERLDFRLVEAGYDLYANRLQVAWRVILPLVKPGIIAGSILVFIPALGAYVIPRVLGGGKQMMMGNLIDLQFGQGKNWPLGAALAIALMVVVMIALMVYVRTAGGSRGSKLHG
jgi:spermidine/putrescine transport system permease protein